MKPTLLLNGDGIMYDINVHVCTISNTTHLKSDYFFFFVMGRHKTFYRMGMMTTSLHSVNCVQFGSFQNVLIYIHLYPKIFMLGSQIIVTHSTLAPSVGRNKINVNVVS